MASSPVRPDRSRKAQICLLLESGESVDADKTPASLRTSGEVVLSRALCRFFFFRTPAGLSRSDAAKAARLKAEADAPFADTKSLLLRAPDGVTIWSWDQSQINALAPGLRDAPVRFVPETLLRGEGEGWRIIETCEGFEAQCWRDGSLIGSTWRRRAFTPEQWRVFAVSIEQAPSAAPDAPPAPTPAPLRASAAWRRRQIGADWSWKPVEDAAKAAALAAGLLAAFGAGFAAREDHLAQKDAAGAHQLQQRLMGDSGARRARAQMDLLNDYRKRMPATDVLAAAADALEVLNRFGLDPANWEASGQTLRFSIAYSPAQTSLHDVIAALESAPSISAVTPEFQAGGETVVVTAHIESAPAPGLSKQASAQ